MPDEPRRVRFWCQIGPAGSKDADWAFSYLEAFLDVGVRVMPIGGLPLLMPYTKPWKRWRDNTQLFTGSVDDNFLNVVCAPLGLSLGMRLTAGRKGMSTGFDTEEPVVTAIGDDEFVAYEPSTAIDGLWTANHANVAIIRSDVVGCNEGNRADLERLGQYDLVIGDDAIATFAQDLSPAQLKERLGK